MPSESQSARTNTHGREMNVITVVYKFSKSLLRICLIIVMLSKKWSTEMKTSQFPSQSQPCLLMCMHCGINYKMMMSTIKVPASKDRGWENGGETRRNTNMQLPGKWKTLLLNEMNGSHGSSASYPCSYKAFSTLCVIYRIMYVVLSFFLTLFLSFT